MAKLFLKPFISTKSFAPSCTTIPIMRQLEGSLTEGRSDAVADRVEEIWIGLLKSKPGVEIRKKLSIKSSLLFWQNLGSLNTQNTCYPGSISITKSSTPSLIWISILVFYWLIISLLCSLNANNTSTRLTTLSSLCEHVDNEYVAV